MIDKWFTASLLIAHVIQKDYYHDYCSDTTLNIGVNFTENSTSNNKYWVIIFKYYNHYKTITKCIFFDTQLFCFTILFIQIINRFNRRKRKGNYLEIKTEAGSGKLRLVGRLSMQGKYYFQLIAVKNIYIYYLSMPYFIHFQDSPKFW